MRTAHGPLEACREVERWPSGLPRRCTPRSACRLLTRAGVLTPRCEPEEPRHPRVSPVEFHDNGQVARVPLAGPRQVPTPLGPLPAELLLFHPDGTLKRLFPTNGKLGDEWGEDDERRLVPELELTTPVGPLRARCISVAFHPGGGLRSVTLWPDERVVVATPLGPVLVRHGVSFHADGSLATLEPARPLRVATPIGTLTAFDPFPVGLNADPSSLGFDPTGAVCALTTDQDALVVTLPDGSARSLAPEVELGDCSDSCGAATPLRLRFEDGAVAIRRGASHESFPVRSVAVARRDARRHLPCVG